MSKPEIVLVYGHWCIQIDGDLYQFPLGTTREHVEGVLAEAVRDVMMERYLFATFRRVEQQP